MKIGYLMAAVLFFCCGPMQAKEKQKGTFQAQRAGWIMGMYVGEEKGQPYPFVTQVDGDSEARIKGIRPGDELIRFDDEETTPLSRLFEKVSKLRPGKEVTLWVRRGSQTLRFFLRVPRAPHAAPQEKASADKSKTQDKNGKGDRAGEGEKSKKKKKRPPVVIKPIPSGE